MKQSMQKLWLSGACKEMLERAMRETGSQKIYTLFLLCESGEVVQLEIPFPAKIASVKFEERELGS
jgi:hypothetical protein